MFIGGEYTLEQETILNEILATLRDFGEQVDKRFINLENKFDQRFIEQEQKFDQRFNQLENRMDKLEDKVDKGFASVNGKIDHLIKKTDGTRSDLIDTQETTNFLLSKVAKHEKNCNKQNVKYIIPQIIKNCYHYCKFI